MLFQLDNKFWEKNFIAEEPDATIGASWDPFSREDVSSIIGISVPEDDDSSNKFFLAGILKDGRYFYIEGPEPYICCTSLCLYDLHSLAMTDTGRIMLPQVQDKLCEDISIEPAEATIYFATESERLMFEDFWEEVGHKEFQKYLAKRNLFF